MEEYFKGTGVGITLFEDEGNLILYQELCSKECAKNLLDEEINNQSKE